MGRDIASSWSLISSLERAVLLERIGGDSSLAHKKWSELPQITKLKLLTETGRYSD